MPVAPRVTYPGVYIQEVPSDVRTITPVDTATTAFLGAAVRGPVDRPVVVNSPADFQKIYGGLSSRSGMSYAVLDFFLNGGSKAVVVRVVGAGAKASAAVYPSAAGPAPPAEQPANPPAEQPAEQPANPPADKRFRLVARSPGVWGDQLRFRVTAPGSRAEVTAAIAARYAVKPESLFTLTLYDSGSGTLETYENVTVDEPQSSRQIDKLLESQSQLAIVVEMPAKPPTAHAAAADGASVWDDVAAKPADTKPADEKPVDPKAKKEGKTEAAEAKKADAVAQPAASTSTPFSGGADGADLDASVVLGDAALKTGLNALEDADIFNLLCIPPYKLDGADIAANVWQAAAAYCEKRRAMLLVDPPGAWNTKDKAKDGFPMAGLAPSGNAAIFFPRLKAADPLRDNQLAEFPPCGAVAGVIARTDGQRGVWKAPAGVEASLRGVYSLTVPLTDAENGELNPLGVNCLRLLPAAGHVVWGARTTVGDDRLASQWKYIPVRRTALFIEESLYRGSQWAVFEPNDEPLWSQLRLNVGSFMNGLFRQGAFQGGSPAEAYFVKCDATTTTQADIDRGIVNVIVGFAPLKPAEFVVLYIQQIAGQLAT